jgi:hypothetical protein
VVTVPTPLAVDNASQLAVALDAASHDVRLKWVRSLGSRAQRRLFELCAGRAVAPDVLAGPDGEIVRYPGRNGLLLFNRFEKRIYRQGSDVFGHNANPPLVRWVTGPGHFAVLDHPTVPGEVLFDYRRLPPGRHPGIPPIRDNEHGLPALVFGDLVDVVRRVSAHVFVGDATKGVFPRSTPRPWLVRLGAHLPSATFVVVRAPAG